MSDALDASNGWDAVATDFMLRRASSAIGLATLQQWATTLPAGAAILDLGCGSGAPNAVALVQGGFHVYGVDASPQLVVAFRENVPEARVACEPVETSDFFDRQFDAAIAIGLIFLLEDEVQRRVIPRIASVLKPGGQFLFTAPTQVATWDDLLTGRQSVSLGEEAYEAILSGVGLRLIEEFVDEGGNHYYLASKSPYAHVAALRELTPP
jgi:SAM-dependent methyltransferase